MRTFSLVLALMALSRPVSAQVSLCEWTGEPALTDLRVETLEPAHISLVALAGRRAAVSLVALGLFRVRTLDDATPIIGTTREAISIAISGEQFLSGVATVSSGAIVDELTPRGDALRGSVTIAEGVRLERVSLPCAALGLASEVSSVAVVGPTAAGPAWLARTRLLRLRARPDLEAPRVTIRMVDRASHVFVERDRRESWVRVVALFPHASLSGWVPDTDLTRVR